jgi:hypothetical protein
MSPRGWVCQPKALARLHGVDPVLIVAEKSVGDGLLMAKKWPAALSTNVLPSAAALRDLDPALYQLEVNRVEPSSPIGSGPYGLWLLTQQRPSSEPVEGSDWHASFEANRTVRSNYWQKSQ